MAWVFFFCAAGLSLTVPAMALADSARFSIPAQPLPQALKAFAAQAHMQLLYQYSAVANAKGNAVSGDLEKHTALEQLLKNSGLEVIYSSDSAATIRPIHSTTVSNVKANDPGGSEAPPQSTGDSLQLAQATAGQTQGDVSVAKKGEEEKKTKKEELQEVVVTGSRILTVSGQGPQDVKVYAKEQIEQSGQTTISDFLNSLPDVSVNIQENTIQTFGGATTVQLHGLPIGTTLVLINGRRVEVSGSQGGTGTDFFDLNTIPIAAVERIEVVPEGSSAVYGSDAIAGVVNVILKQDYQGLEAAVKYGAAKDIHETTASLAWGERWANASMSVIGSLQTRSELTGFERPLTATDDKTPFGGTDHQLDVCNPGTVFSLNGSNLPGLAAPNAAVPAGFTGTPTIQEFIPTAGRTNYCNIGGYSSLIPATRREGLIAHGNYDPSPSTSIFTEVMYSHVEQLAYGDPPFAFANSSFSAYTVSASNPYNPFGTPVGISYLFTDVARQELPLYTDFLRALVGAKGSLSETWKWEVAAWDSQDRSTYSQDNGVNGEALQNALNSSMPASALNLFTAGVPGSPQLLHSILYDQVQRFFGQTLSTDGLLRGQVVQTPSGPVEAVFGSEYSRDKIFFDFVNVAGLTPNTQGTFDRTRYAVFGEARVPIIGNSTGAPQGDRLAVTLAGRYDHYSDFGGKATPQLAAEWRPIESLLTRASYGKAFKAPSLYDLNSPVTTFQGFVNDPKNGGQQVPVTVTNGGNPALRPETGQSRAFGFVYSSKLIPGLELAITDWSIDESNNIQPLAPQVLVDYESLFPGAVVRNAAGMITQVNATFTNFGDMKVSGLDYHIGYTFRTSFGQFQPSVTATQTYHYTFAFLPGVPAINGESEANDSGLFAPRWKGTLALSWKLGPCTATWLGRYVGRYQDYDSRREIGNFWLSDVNVRYAIGESLAHDNSVLKHSFVEFGGVNVFNKLPQFSNFDFGSLGYDPAESDIRGRFLYVQAGIKL